jgi:hypothetical protein
MKKPVLIAGIASVVALAVIAIALAASGGGSDNDSNGGSVAGGACPAIDFPGISDEDRERCYGLDSPGGDVNAGGGAAGNSCPAIGVPGVTDREREDCYNQDSPGSGAPPLDQSGGKLPALPDDRRAVEAPIDGLDVLTLESFPPQYVLHVQAGLPSGCAERYGSEVERVGDVITVTVLNTIPADGNVACTAIYGFYDFNLPLGSEFVSGVTYTVQVNDQETTFTAQ